MNVPLERKTVRMERHIGADTQQVVVEGSFALPANLPDITRVVRLAAHPVVTDRTALEDEIIVHGAVDFVLVYAHDEEVVRPPREARSPAVDEGTGTEIEAERGEGVDSGFHDEPAHDAEYREILYRHRWRRGAVFEAIFDVPGAHQNVTVDVRTQPLDVEVHLHTNGRGIDAEAVVAAAVRVLEDDIQAVCVKHTNFPDSIDADERTLSVENVFLRTRTNVSVEGTLPLSTETPAKTVVDVRATVRLDDIHVDESSDGDRRLVGGGSIQYKAVVMDQRGEMESFVWQQQTPFTFSLDGVDRTGLGGDRPDRAGNPGLAIEAEAVLRGLDAAPNSDGSGVDVFADIDISARIAAVEPLTVITDIRGDDDRQISYRTDTFRLEQWIGQHKRELDVSAQLDVPQGAPPIERLLGADATVRIEDVLVLGDKVIIEAELDVSGLYVARTEGSPAHYVEWTRAIALEGEIAVPDAEPGMEADVKVDVIGVELDLLNRETVEAIVTLNARAKVTHPVERDAVVEAVVVLPPEADPPTLTFVVVQADDTLWTISHRYHTDVSDIVRANPWLESADDALPLGRKLCVPRHKAVPPTPKA